MPLRKYFCTALYILFIILINTAFTYAPFYQIWGFDFSPMDFVVGIIYILRDFSQRELGHYIFFAMLIGAGASYVMADPQIAIASLSAFLVGEIVDWLVFTFSKKSLKERLLWSAGLSAPIDSIVFLTVIGRLNIVAMALMTASKLFGVWLIWLLYNRFSSKTEPLGQGKIT